MRFSLSTPAMILYPAIMSAWEPDAGGPEILRYAKAADGQRWSLLTIPEHVFMPSEMVEVMGARFPEAMTAAGVVAGATERIRVMPYILVLPYRNPLMLAKQIATVDFLSGGRFVLGTAVGHLEREFELLGVPFSERGKVADESLEAMKIAWTSDSPSFSGRYFSFDGIAFEPKPVQEPHPPIWIGGNSKPAMRRAAKYGDGWLPWLVPVDELPACVEYLKQQPGFEAKADRFEILMPLSALQVEDYSHQELGETQLLSGRDEILKEVEVQRQAGVTISHIVPPRTASLEQLLEWIEWFDQTIIPQCS